MKTVSIISFIGAIIQILGGIFTVYALIERSVDPNFNLLISASIAVPLILLNFVASILLMRTNSPKGVLLMLFHFLLQTVQFKFKGLYFFYALGPYLGFGFVKNAGQEISIWWDSSEFIFFQLIHFVDDKIGSFLQLMWWLFFLLWFYILNTETGNLILKRLEKPIK